MKKVTYTLDDETVAAIRRAATRSNRPQSAIVRAAVAAYGDGDRLPESERRRLLIALRAYQTAMPKRSMTAVEKELREIRASRRIGWQRRSDGRRR
jgi:predicted transcriptional regulator